LGGFIVTVKKQGGSREEKSNKHWSLQEYSSLLCRKVGRGPQWEGKNPKGNLLPSESKRIQRAGRKKATTKKKHEKLDTWRKMESESRDQRPLTNCPKIGRGKAPIFESLSFISGWKVERYDIFGWPLTG